MTRDNRDRLDLFSDYGNVQIIRVALNVDQVRRYNPPPNPAKLNDTRAPDYIERFGEQSWELDALDPRVIDELISNEIKKYIDKDKWEIIKERENATKLKLAKMAKRWKDGLD